jgi:mRNA interferase RelE/StbE
MFGAETDVFWKDLKRFSPKIQDIILSKIELLAENPDHPSLRTEKLYKSTKKRTRASSISMGIRLLWELENDTIRLLNVGKHDIYREY